MSKAIVYLADGTWNTGALTHTHVHHFAQLLSRVGQEVLYDGGVGTKGGLVAFVRGGALGEGLVEDVRKGYAGIAARYRPGDRLYLFGFSRGAYTARSVGGMIDYCGLPVAGGSAGLVDRAFAAYRARVEGVRRWPSRPAGLVDAQVEMVGVWDTVGTLGVPGALFGVLDQARFGFLNVQLPRSVKAGCQALALDEKHRRFPPTLWAEPAAPGQVLKQVWFAGTHLDVGGVGPSKPLSDLTLAWMVREAAARGLKFADGHGFDLPMPRGHALGWMYSAWNLVGLGPRARVVPDGARVADSVGVRLAQDRRYRPPLQLLPGPERRLGGGYALEPVVGG